MKNGSELVVLAKEIHEGILRKIEDEATVLLFLKTKATKFEMEIVPEFFDISKEEWVISDGINAIHIISEEIEHIEKDEDIHVTFYELYYKNGDCLTISI